MPLVVVLNKDVSILLYHEHKYSFSQSGRDGSAQNTCTFAFCNCYMGYLTFCTGPLTVIPKQIK